MLRSVIFQQSVLAFIRCCDAKLQKWVVTWTQIICIFCFSTCIRAV